MARSKMIDKASAKNSPGPELFIGLVGAVGTELDRVIHILQQALNNVNYGSEVIRLASLLRAIPRYSGLPTKNIDEYTDSHMTAGDEFRKITERSDAVAILGIGDIITKRVESGRRYGEIKSNWTYIIRSLKNPAEVTTLRQTYGDSFYLIAAYSPYQKRKAHLAKRIARSRNEYPYDRHFPVADCLMLRDREEAEMSHGQNTQDVFHRADVFLDMTDISELKKEVDRFIELIFGNSFHTPTKPEYAMFHAQAAALRSAELGRQVGAAIATENGDIVSVGTNEVPEAGGGLYWCTDMPDRREFRLGSDSNDEHKRELISETLQLLRAAGWLDSKRAKLELEDLVSQALDQKKPVLRKDSKIRNLIEYGRAVHAEMASLTDAALRGVSVAGCTMYVTTFPCHLCARHIVAAGIKRVIYIEPYAKSLAAELYPDSIIVDGGEPDGLQVPFEPFMGISPRQYMNLFYMSKRKDPASGDVFEFSPSNAKLRFYELPRVYLENEDLKVKNLGNKIKRSRILRKKLEWIPICGQKTGS